MLQILCVAYSFFGGCCRSSARRMVSGWVPPDPKRGALFFFSVPRCPNPVRGACSWSAAHALSEGQTALVYRFGLYFLESWSEGRKLADRNSRFTDFLLPKGQLLPCPQQTIFLGCLTRFDQFLLLRFLKSSRSFNRFHGMSHTIRPFLLL